MFRNKRMAKRKSISKKTRFEVFKRDSFTCQYCGGSAPAVILRIDHIQPVSKEGEDDILNLITACFDCNAGKSDRLLSDDSVIQKQKAQLDDLNKRREQLEMMLEWREGLKEIDEIGVDAFAKEWGELTKTFRLTESGMQSARKLIRTFGLNLVLDSMPKAERYFEIGEDGDYTSESVSIAFKKVGGICRMVSQPEWKKELYYIRGIARNRFQYCNDIKIMVWLERAYNDGVDIADLKNLALTAKHWTDFRGCLFDAMGWEDE